MNPKKLRAGLAGLGMGRQHGQLMNESGRFEVAAFCDPDDSRLADTQALFPQARYYRSQAEMLAVEQLDIVAQATPHFLHAPLAIEALEAGLHVVVEKPMATTAGDCAAMIAAAQRSGKVLTVYHNRRLDPWFLAARQLVESGRLGKVFEIAAGIGYASTSRTWRGDRKASGGVMFDWGAHLVDYILHLVASRPERVSGWFFADPSESPERNQLHGTLRIFFASGASACITVSARDFASQLRYRILGTEGTYQDPWNWLPEQHGVLHRRNPADPRNHLTEEIPYVKPAAEYYQLLAASLLDGEPLLVTPESAARIIEILDLAQQSHAAGGQPLPVSNRFG